MFRAVLVLVASVVTLVAGVDTRVENNEMTDANPNSCDTIIDSGSKFSGDCCSLTKGDDGGCILNIINGNCVITGQYWTIDWTSTLTSNGAKCPESADYPEYAPAATAAETTDPPTSETPPADGAFAVVGGIIMSPLVAGVLVVAGML
jgi:hypothetical protein